MSKILTQFRKSVYKAGRVAGDVQVISSGKPFKMAKRGGNKMLGRLFGKLWLR